MTQSKDSRKQMIREYKEREKQIGIFTITNKATGRVFLDLTMTLDRAYNKHHFQLNMGSHPNKELQADWIQYGEDNFLYDVIERLEQESADAKALSADLAELKALCRENLAAMPDITGFY